MWKYNYRPYIEHGFKYIDRYRVNGKWRYVYADKKTHKTMRDNQWNDRERNSLLKSAEKSRKRASDVYRNYDESRKLTDKLSGMVWDEYKLELMSNMSNSNVYPIYNHKDASSDYVRNKQEEGYYRKKAAELDEFSKKFYDDIEKNEVTWNNAINAGKNFLKKLTKKKTSAINITTNSSAEEAIRRAKKNAVNEKQSADKAKKTAENIKRDRQFNLNKQAAEGKEFREFVLNSNKKHQNAKDAVFNEIDKMSETFSKNLKPNGNGSYKFNGRVMNQSQVSKIKNDLIMMKESYLDGTAQFGELYEKYRKLFEK